MKGLIKYFAILLTSLACLPSYAVYYETVVPDSSFVTSGITNAGPSGDDSYMLVNIGFSFPFNGTTYSQVYINSNGSLSFGTGYTAYNNTSIPRSSPNSFILPYWDDLNPRARGSIKYGTTGSSPDRQFIAWWDDVPLYPWNYSYNQTSCSFQVVLHEDGRIRFRYGNSNMNCDGSYATIGEQENGSSPLYIQHSYNTAIDLTKDIVYAPYKPVLSFTKTSQVLWDPTNDYANPKRIPGAKLRYTLQIENSNASHAADVNITDTLTSGVSWIASPPNNLTVTNPFINGGLQKSLTDAIDSDEGQFSGNAIAVNCSFITNDGPCVVTFDVLID